MRFSHVIATRGRPEVLRDAVESSLAQIGDVDGEIIVVDGHPERSAEPVVQELQPRANGVSLTYLAGVSGLCAQRNHGMEAARGEIVVFTDDDATLRPGFFAALDGAYADPVLVGATGRVHEPDDDRIGSGASRWRQRLLRGRQGSMTGYGFRRPVIDEDRPHDMEYMFGTFMSARLEVARQVRFDEGLERLSGYALGEDDDFSYRLSRRGVVRFLPDAAVDHRATGKNTMDKREFDRLVVTNRMYIYRKNFAAGWRAHVGFALLIVTIFVHRALNRDWQGLRGLVEGLGETRRAMRHARGAQIS